jgi:hypothetical protein
MRVSTLFLYIFEKRFDVKKSRGIAFLAVFWIGSGFSSGSLDPDPDPGREKDPKTEQS